VNEEEARETVRSLVDGDGFARLERLVALVLHETERQNLIARSTMAAIWNRHVFDSVQLLRLSDPGCGLWMDIGTGGGFPGLAVAAAQDSDVLLVEPRKLRAGFLANAVDWLGLRHTRVLPAKVEAAHLAAATISARAVAPVEKLLHAARHCATPTTRWLFLKGQLLPDELTTLEQRSGLMFHVEQSLSDPQSAVLVTGGQ
jgi:16S rRNA (guanine527-N7)-methyltransferase